MEHIEIARHLALALPAHVHGEYDGFDAVLCLRAAACEQLLIDLLDTEGGGSSKTTRVALVRKIRRQLAEQPRRASGHYDASVILSVLALNGRFVSDPDWNILTRSLIRNLQNSQVVVADEEELPLRVPVAVAAAAAAADALSSSSSASQVAVPVSTKVIVQV